MKNSIKFLSLGCRLNTLEAEKICALLENAGTGHAIVINTCSVTAEAERQSKQAIRRIIRENPGAKIFVTGCAATRKADDFAAINGVTRVVDNKDKMNVATYLPEMSETDNRAPVISKFSTLSKGFVQIQNGCNHSCAYCIVSKLRGRNVSFPYDQILAQVRALADNGYSEIVLTGVDIAGYRDMDRDLAGLCRALLRDVSGLHRLRLSSLDPGIDLIPIVELMRNNPRMMGHMHLSMQSGSDAVLARMGRRHNAAMVRGLVERTNKPNPCAIPALAAGVDSRNMGVGKSIITFSWDLICGFPGETLELFEETCALIRELKPIRLHAFPFSPRPGTPAATMPDQVPRTESKRRVKIATEIARENMRAFMRGQIGITASVLIEENNIARTPDDIPVKISGKRIPARTIVNVELTGILDGQEFMFSGKQV